MPHPLDPLGADEIRDAVALLRADTRVPDDPRFADVYLDEPPKDVVAAFDAANSGATSGDFFTPDHRQGRPSVQKSMEAREPDRRVRFRLVTGPELSAVEAVVSLSTREVGSGQQVDGVCPTILLEESWLAGEAVKADPRWQAAMNARGITDFDHVAVDPWPAGRFGLPEEEGRRLARAISYVRERPEDNQHARPVEGVVALVDLGRAEVLDVVDLGGAPVPEGRGRYVAGETTAWRDDLRPIEITQPEGPSFTIDGNVVRWQRWSMRVSLDPHEGLVFHSVGYEDGGRVRPILHRASITEMIVPYGDPGPMHGWKNAFDASEWGLGKMANSLEQGCDCLGEIRYLDAVMTGERGDPT